MNFPFEYIDDNAEQHPITNDIPNSEGTIDSLTTPSEDMTTALVAPTAEINATFDPEFLKRVMLFEEIQLHLEEETEREHHEIKVQGLYRQIALLQEETSELRRSVAIMENEVTKEQNKKNLMNWEVQDD